MPLIRTETLPNIVSVGANQRFTVNAPVGNRSYRHITLDKGENGSNIADSAVSNIEVLINGTAQQEYESLADLQVLNTYYGIANNANEIMVPFHLPFMDDINQRNQFNFGVSDVSTLQIRASIAAAVSPSVQGNANYVIYADGDRNPSFERNRLGVFRKTRNFTYSLVGSGVTEISDIPREALLMALHLLPDADVITRVEVRLDNNDVRTESRAKMISEVSRFGRTVGANNYHIDFMNENTLDSLLPLIGAQDFRLRISHSGPATLKLYADYFSNFLVA